VQLAPSVDISNASASSVSTNGVNAARVATVHSIPMLAHASVQLAFPAPNTGFSQVSGGSGNVSLQQHTRRFPDSTPPLSGTRSQSYVLLSRSVSDT
jgi:hypothetical protein